MFATLSANITATFDKIMRTDKRAEKIRQQKINELKDNIEYTKTQMKLAIDNFNNVVEPKLIDFYIYKIQSEQTRFEQLVAEYKSVEGYPLSFSEDK